MSPIFECTSINLKGSFHHNNFDNSILLENVSTYKPGTGSESHISTRLISSSSSCEESCSSSSNDSCPEMASASQTVSLLSQNHHSSRRGPAQKRKYIDYDDDPSYSSRNSSTCNFQVMGQIAAEREPHQSNVWDDSDWILSSPFATANDKNENDTVDTSSSPITSTTNNFPQMACDRSKHSKVQGVMFATTNSLYAQISVWDDTDWKFPPSVLTTKKRKTMGMLNMPTEKDTKNKVDVVKNNGNGPGLKCRSKGKVLPIKHDSAKRGLCKTSDKSHDEKHRNYLSLMPIVSNRQMGIAYLTKNQHLNGHWLSSIDSPYILYRWLRVRLEAGLVWSSFDFLHRRLKQHYDEVVKNLGKTQKDETTSLSSLRDRIADIWCVYALFSLEVGCRTLARLRERQGSFWDEIPSEKNDVQNSGNGIVDEDFDTEAIDGATEYDPLDKKTNSSVVNCLSDDQYRSTMLGNKIIASKEYTSEEREVPFENDQDCPSIEDVCNHAISILLSARECPFVGNHVAINASLGRLIVSATVVGKSKLDCARVELSREILSTKIQSAIDVCWDGINACRCNQYANRRYEMPPVSKTAIMSLYNFQDTRDKSHWEKGLRPHFLQEGIISTFLLPTTLPNPFPSSTFAEQMVVSDKNTIRCLCEELNRWSRLREKLSINSNRTMRIAPCHDSEILFAAEELPLYTTLEFLSDPLNHYEGVVIPGREIIWQW